MINQSELRYLVAVAEALKDAKDKFNRRMTPEIKEYSKLIADLLIDIKASSSDFESAHTDSWQMLDYGPDNSYYVYLISTCPYTMQQDDISFPAEYLTMELEEIKKIELAKVKDPDKLKMYYELKEESLMKEFLEVFGCLFMEYVL